MSHACAGVQAKQDGSAALDIHNSAAVSVLNYAPAPLASAVSISPLPIPMPLPADLPPEVVDSDAEDVAWMHRVKTGDAEAFERLVEKHQGLVCGTAARMLATQGDAEDIAQQVFVRVWRSASRYEPRAKFTTWLLTITRNLVFNELRRRQRQNPVPLDHENSEDERPLPDPNAKSPALAALDAEMQASIESAIAKLPENQRLAIILVRYGDIAYEEIAEVLGVSVSSVKSLLFRARTQLRESLAAYLGDA